MKKKEGIHPKYQQVLFVDSSTGYRFICGSTLQPKERETFEGKEFPVQRVSTSSASHPFFCGGQQFVDAEGRVDKFRKRYANSSAAQVTEVPKEIMAAPAAPAPKKAEAKAPTKPTKDAGKPAAKGAPAKAPPAKTADKKPAAKK